MQIAQYLSLGDFLIPPHRVALGIKGGPGFGEFVRGQKLLQGFNIIFVCCSMQWAVSALRREVGQGMLGMLEGLCCLKFLQAIMPHIFVFISIIEHGNVASEDTAGLITAACDPVFDTVYCCKLTMTWITKAYQWVCRQPGTKLERD